MDQSQYTFDFPDVTGSLGLVRGLDCFAGKDIRFWAGLDDSQFGMLSYNPMPPNFADAADIAFAVAVADRLSIARGTRRRQIKVCLPVRNPDFLNKAHIVQGLQDNLYDFTGDNWLFTFTRRKALGRLPELERCLPSFDHPKGSREVALWSGGLDALAGLHRRIKMANSANLFTLFGSSSNQFILKRQRDVMASYKSYYWPAVQSSLGLVQTTIKLSDTRRWRKNSAPRARGFVFLLLGAICAAMELQDTLHIYENGVGAINLPFRASEVGLDHSRAVYPPLLRRMGHLVSKLLDHSFSFHNPFEFTTKAEMCSDLVAERLFPVIQETVSCDRRRRSKPMQCGCCSSCLLRRQALAVNKFIEPARMYLSTNDVDLGRRLERLGIGHLGAMLSQISDLQKDTSSASPWVALKRRYPELADVADEIAVEDGLDLLDVQERLVRLYAHYVSEWNAVQSILQPS